MRTCFPTREAALGGFVCMSVTDCCVIMITTYVVRTIVTARFTRERYDRETSMRPTARRAGPETGERRKKLGQREAAKAPWRRTTPDGTFSPAYDAAAAISHFATCFLGTSVMVPAFEMIQLAWRV